MKGSRAPTSDPPPVRPAAPGRVTFPAMPTATSAPPAAPLAGRTCVVTGATAGIGLVTARELARRGATVVLVGRSDERGARALDAVRAAAPGADASFLRADLAVQADVRACAAALRARHPAIHVLVNNAGAVFDRREETVDGIERTLALNHMAYFLLTRELLEPLRAAGAATGDARVVNVASDAHRAAPTTLAGDDLQLRRGWSQVKAYNLSKLWNVMFTYALARRLAGSGVTANALHPGVIASDFGRGQGGGFGILFALFRPFMISPERGARTSLVLAAAPEVAGATGGYYKRGRPTRSSRPSYDEARQEWLWTESERLLRA